MAYKKSAETKAKIIDAAITLFNENGYYGTYIKDIAQMSNIAHPCIYYYFDGKEGIAREIYDKYVDEILEKTNQTAEKTHDLFVNIMVESILFFRYISLNKVTQALYYDIVQYSNYDKENLERLNKSFFSSFSKLFSLYDSSLSETQALAHILTCSGFAKALFKGIIDGILDFTFEEACDYFFRHIILSKIKISEDEYKEKLQTAFQISNQIEINIKEL